MGGEWREVRLGDVYSFRSGLSKPRSAFGKGYGFLTFKDVFYNTFTPERLGDLVESTERDRELCSIRRGDVFLTRTSETQDELGMSCVALRDYESATFNGFCKRLRPKDGACIVPEYAAYYFRGPAFRRGVTAMSSLSTRASLNEGMLERLTVILPSLETQHCIGMVLKTLDDKIELNRQMNETLEAMARALFKSWFVDFDPVRAMASGRQPAGMDAATANLFPDAFEMSELGEIPRGWAWITLGAVSHLNPESWTANNRPSEIRYVDLSNTKWGRIESTSRYVWSEAPSRAQRILRVGDTIFGVVRPGNGSFALVRQSGLTGSTGFAVLRSKSALHAPFVYLAATAKENVDRLSHLADGAAYPAIRPDQLLDTPIIQTHAKVLDAFDGKAELYLAKMAANDMQAESLSALRDTLLRPLLSGELSIPDAERFVERAV